MSDKKAIKTTAAINVIGQLYQTAKRQRARSDNGDVMTVHEIASDFSLTGEPITVSVRLNRKGVPRVEINLDIGDVPKAISVLAALLAVPDSAQEPKPTGPIAANGNSQIH